MRVLRWFARSGLIEPDDVREMLAWGNRLCSVDAGVCVAAQDRAGLKHVLHYFARPLYVRFVEHCCCLRPMVRCPLLADTRRRRPEPPPAAVRWFARSGLIEPDDVREVLAWENSGFSLCAARVWPRDVRFVEWCRRQ